MSVSVARLDHVNIRTAQLDRMVSWYGSVLGLQPGPRPDFAFPGAWLYAGGQAVIHLIEVAVSPPACEDLALEHFALSASGLSRFISVLEAAGERHMLRPVPGFPILQVNLWDPDGNHLHVDFDSAEADGTDIAS